jgi:tight adherence protein B
MQQDAAAILLLAFVCLLAMAGLALYVSGSSRRAALAERGSGGGEEPGVARLRQGVDAALRRRAAGRRLANWLMAAGSPVGAADFLLLTVAGLAFLWIVLTYFMTPVVALIVAALIVVGASRSWVERRRNARKLEFIAQLPDLARVLSNGTSAGLSMAGAVQLAARELDEPAGTEMRLVVQETRLGLSMEESLERLRDRLPSREVSVLMTTLVIQQRAGGDTVRAMSELGSTLEARKDLQREIRTMLSGAVFTSYLVMIMGVGTIVLINVISPGVLKKMTSSALGIVALSIAAILYGIAYVFIRRITKVEM